MTPPHNLSKNTLCAWLGCLLCLSEFGKHWHTVHLVTIASIQPGGKDTMVQPVEYVYCV